jgi:tetratricopeptide (TPR) repeat protein
MRAWSYALLGIATALVIGAATLAPTAAAARPPDGERSTLLGSYLAGRLARSKNDVAAAAVYYGKALERDPDSDVLSDSAFQMEASQGNWPRVETLARDLLQKQPTHRLARAFMGLAEFKAGRYAEAEAHFKEASAHPVGELTGALARAWLYQAQHRTQEALAALDAPKLPDWASYFLRYHRALIAEAAGRNAEARVFYERIAKSDQRPLRVALAYARHAARAGDARLALSILSGYVDRAKGEPHPYALALLAEVEAGKRPQPLIAGPLEGMAEAFYGLGEALSGEGSFAIGMIFLQFSLYLVPDATFPLVTLANAQEQTKRYAAAIAAYERIGKGTPIDVHVAIRTALNLGQLERVDEAKKLLDDLASENPQDIRPLEALGGIMRGQKRFTEAADYYTRAIALIEKPEQKHWTFFYSRGTCFERLKQLPQAEADLQRSLKLSPDQPLTLNYLGYTWIDHNRNLKRGLAMIEKAVRLKPDDGYIVDSLGWAHYRLANFKKAVKHLEKAVELRPEDPTLNDHLGDAYWRVGREREARFQWEQALTLQPEPAEADKMREKLEKGLPPLAQERPAKRGKSASRLERRKKRSAAGSPFAQ